MVARSSAVSRDVAQHQARLRGQVGQQLVLGGGDRLVPRLYHGDRAEQLTGVPDRDRPVSPARSAGSPRVAGERDGRGRRRDPRGQVTCGRSSPPTRTQTSHPDRAGGPGQHRGHPVERRVGVQLPGHVLGEVGEHLVGRGPLPVDQAVGEQLGPLPHRLEQHRDRHRRRDREHRAAGVPASVPMPTTMPA